jgi:hypothetical protein
LYFILFFLAFSLFYFGIVTQIGTRSTFPRKKVSIFDIGECGTELIGKFHRETLLFLSISFCPMFHFAPFSPTFTGKVYRKMCVCVRTCGVHYYLCNSNEEKKMFVDTYQLQPLLPPNSRPISVARTK